MSTGCQQGVNMVITVLTAPGCQLCVNQVLTGCQQSVNRVITGC